VGDPCDLEGSRSDLSTSWSVLVDRSPSSDISILLEASKLMDPSERSESVPKFITSLPNPPCSMETACAISGRLSSRCCKHNRAVLSTRCTSRISSLRNSILGSTMSIMLPLECRSCAHVVRIACSGGPVLSRHFLPLTISRHTTPKLKTSAFSLNCPTVAYSGAR